MPLKGFPGGPVVKTPSASAGDAGVIPGVGRSPGKGKSNPLQCSCLENPKDRGAWRAMVYRVTKSWTRLKQLRTSLAAQTVKRLSTMQET